MDLTYNNLRDVTLDCLYRPEELPENPSKDNLPEGAVLSQGVMTTLVLHPERLESHREDIRSMLSQLDDSFMKSKGGGMSMLNMPFTKDGTQYGEQRDADALFMLGQAIGCASFVLPREMWAMFPGGLPYVAVSL